MSAASALFFENSANNLWQITEEGNRFGPLVTTKRSGTSGGYYLFDGTATQGSASGKANSVTLNTRSGAITMNNSLLAADTTVSFTLNNLGIDADDEITAWHASAGTLGAYNVNALANNGTAAVYVRNITGGSLSEAIVVKYLIKKRQ